MNNSKRYLFAAVGVLLILLAGISLLQNLLNRPGAGSPSSPTPTLSGYSYSGYRSNGKTGNTTNGAGGSDSSASGASSSVSEEEKARQQMQQLKRQLPQETGSYTVKYSSKLDKVVMTRKTETADQDFNDWLGEHGFPLVVGNPATTIYTNKSMEQIQTALPTQSPDEKINMIINLGTQLLNPQSTLPTAPPEPTSPPASSSQSSSSPTTYTPKEYGGYVYYNQCYQPYKDSPLAAGCTICDAGCGPTTVAMILSSFVDKKYDPIQVVSEYKSGGAAACGTSMWYAKSLLESHGIQTTDYIIPWKEGVDYSIDEVRSKLKSYLDGGWTIMVLAYYKPNQGGGHYFWLTDIDGNGNAMAFDPWYGLNQTPPISENVRYPIPRYAAAFGVKLK